MSVQQTLAMGIVMGIAYTLTMKVTSNASNRVMEKKGFIGAVFVGIFLGVFIIINGRILADYVGSTTSETQFFGILILVAVFLIIIWEYRSGTYRAIRTTSRVSKKSVQKAKNKRK